MSAEHERWTAVEETVLAVSTFWEFVTQLGRGMGQQIKVENEKV